MDPLWYYYSKVRILENRDFLRCYFFLNVLLETVIYGQAGELRTKWGTCLHNNQIFPSEYNPEWAC